MELQTRGCQSGTERYPFDNSSSSSSVPCRPVLYRSSENMPKQLSGHVQSVKSIAHLQSGAIYISGKLHLDSMCHCQHFIRIDLTHKVSIQTINITKAEQNLCVCGVTQECILTLYSEKKRKKEKKQEKDLI